MIERSIFTSFLLLSTAGVIKASYIGMKLFIIAACGLAGMYMMHLLAQDYNKYQSLNRPGRSVREAHLVPDFEFNPENVTIKSTVNILKEIEDSEKEHKRNELITLDRILQFDPTGCARRYVCTIAAKSAKKRTRGESNIMQMLRSLPNRRRSDSGQEAFNYALNLGRKTKDPGVCADEYPKCLFTISQMLKLLIKALDSRRVPICRALPVTKSQFFTSFLKASNLVAQVDQLRRTTYDYGIRLGPKIVVLPGTEPGLNKGIAPKTSYTALANPTNLVLTLRKQPGKLLPISSECPALHTKRGTLGRVGNDECGSNYWIQVSKFKNNLCTFLIPLPRKY